MLPENRAKILDSISDQALLLDIGGWAKPFGRADYVVDAFPYETRGVGGGDTADSERFTRETWVVSDVNRLLPFSDNQFDYVTCSHTLEDIRDPLSLCAEIVRVGKAGYIEVPSRMIESVYGLEGHYAGYYHHRWLVEVEGAVVTFRPKLHLLHSSRRFYLPRRTAEKATEEEKVTWLFWEREFRFEEIVNISKRETEAELAEFRGRIEPPSRVKVAMEDPKSTLATFVRAHPFTRKLASTVLGRELTPDDADPWSIAPELRLH